jgi:hypothetical protein
LGTRRERTVWARRSWTPCKGSSTGAAELALACDIRLAAEHASFRLPEALWGGFPGAAGPVRLLRHALEWSAGVDEGMAAHREGRPPRFTGR